MHEPLGAVPFRVDVADAVLDDLHQRLVRTRYPIEPAAPAWHYGTKRDYLSAMIAYWRDEYDWRKSEAAINRFPQYKVGIDGKQLHFILEPGSGPAPLPLLLSHGWPGSVVEFLGVIEPLAHPERFGGAAEDGFTIVVPSLPGYGFSDPPDAPIAPRDIASIFHRLMTDVLGCSRYVAQGGDWGAMITSWLALDHPEPLAAIHLNMMGLLPEGSVGQQPLDAEEQAWIERQNARRAREAGYQQIQGTKPTTLAYALTDSPAGLAAWILEKFHNWTIPGQDAAPPFDRDLLLANIMLYWLAGPNAASWLYCSLLDGSARRPPQGARIEVPTGMMLMPNDLAVPPPSRWIERAYRLVHRRDPPDGGHFPAFEKPALFVEEVRGFFRRFRA